MFSPIRSVQRLLNRGAIRFAPTGFAKRFPVLCRKSPRAGESKSRGDFGWLRDTARRAQLPVILSDWFNGSILSLGAVANRRHHSRSTQTCTHFTPDHSER